MDNIQLAVLLSHIKKNLSNAIKSAGDMMPEDIERMATKHYTGTNPLPGLDFKNWEYTKDGNPIAFKELILLHDDLDNQINNLNGISEISRTGC